MTKNRKHKLEFNLQFVQHQIRPNQKILQAVMNCLPVFGTSDPQNAGLVIVITSL